MKIETLEQTITKTRKLQARRREGYVLGGGEKKVDGLEQPEATGDKEQVRGKGRGG